MQLIEALAPFLIPITIVALLWRFHGSPYESDGWWFITGITAVLLTIGWFIAALAVYLGTLGTVASLEAFSAETLATYEYTIDETRQIVLNDNALTDFSDQAASERIAELRDRIAWYNEKIAEFRKFEGIPFIGAIVADVPDELQPIALPR